MAVKEFKINGQVIDVKTREGVLGLKVEAWEKAMACKDLLGSAVTDEQGNFVIAFDTSSHQAMFHYEQAVILFKIYKQDLPVKSTYESLRKITANNNNLVIEVDLPPEQFSVSGYVVKPDRTPLEGMMVNAYDKGLGKEIPLGDCLSNEDGFYRIIYKRSQLSDKEKERADLFVRVFENKEAKDPAAASPLILNALPDEIVNLAIGEGDYIGPCDYELLAEKLEPQFKGKDLDLDERDVLFLSNRTGIDAMEIAYFVKAAKLARTTGISSEIFYGLFRQQMPTDLNALLSQDINVLRQALEKAADSNMINPGLRKHMDDIVQSFQDQIIEQSLTDREDSDVPDAASLKKLLSVTGLPVSKQKTLLKAYINNIKPVNKFWKDFRNHKDFGDRIVDELQLALQLGAVTRNHLPLIEKLWGHSDVKSARDLAKFDVEGWKDLLNGITIPEDIKGDTNHDKKNNYALAMTRIVEDAFPTAVVANKMDSKVFNNELRTFLLDNDFEFRGGNLNDYTAKIKKLDDSGNLHTDLEAMQRIFRLTPRYEKYDTIKILWQNNLRSAQAIKRKGENEFVGIYTAGLQGSEKVNAAYNARAIYANACKVAAISLTAMAKFGKNFNNIGLHALSANTVQELSSDLPDLETLFGSSDYCDCKHCRSVLSPAAYLADTLVFLEEKGTVKDGSGNARDKLMARRPDIANIQLSCHNTETPLPYIDLVNEVLENAVMKIFDFKNQTGWEAKELKANPEHILPDAYDILAKATYPGNFCLWLEEARVYLEHLGVPRYRLMETFRHDDTDSPSQLEIALEYLKITPGEYRMIAPNKAILELDPRDYFGVDAFSSLENVPELLKRAFIEYEELLELMESRFVNPKGKAISYSSPEACSLTGAKIKFKHEKNLKRFCYGLFCFNFLEKKLGWTVMELDKTMTAFNVTNKIDDDFILNLMYIKRLQEEIKLPLVNMLTWWSLIDVAAYNDTDCLYNRLFLNTVVNNPVVEEFKLNDDGKKIIGIDTEINNIDFSPIILAAINVKEEDFLLMVKEEIREELPLTRDASKKPLNLANLSHLYRVASFAKSFKMSIKEYLTLKVLTGLNPLADQGLINGSLPKNTMAFIAVFKKIKKSGFDIETLDYLLRHHYSLNSSIPPSAEEITRFLEELRTELQKIRESCKVEDDKEASLEGKLSLLFDEQEKISFAMDIIKGTSSESIDEQTKFIKENFSLFLDTESAITNLTGTSALTDTEARIDFVLVPLMAYLLDYLMDNGIVRILSAALGIEAIITEKLLKQYLTFPKDSASKIIHVFKDEKLIDSFPEESVTGSSYPNQFNAFELLFKVSLFINTLGIEAEELNFLFQKGPVSEWLDLKGLPLSAEEETSSFAAFMRLIDTYELQKKLFPGDFSLFDLLDMSYIFESFAEENSNDIESVKASILKLLDITTVWEDEEIKRIAEEEGYALSWTNVTELEQLRKYLVLKFSSLNTGWGVKAISDFAAEKKYDLTSAGKPMVDFLEHLIFKLLSEHTGWNLEDIYYLVSAHGYGFPGDYSKNEKWLMQLQKAFEIIKRIGCSAEQIWSWNTAEVADFQARAIKNAAKAKYGNEKWLEIAPPLNDQLREKNRDALLGYILANYPGFQDPDDLYDYLLMDTEMSAYSMTSRIKQAICSVQLFVQRILMNLEPRIELDRDAAEEWKWRKNYRVWEANRKVFLYPENWIEPELRDDKSPFFKDLENELLQDDVDSDTAERVYLNYLEKLDEVSQLSIRGMYKDEEQNIWHVFGRTKGTPHIYYYRQWVEESYWTPWEKVDLDIEGNHLLPVVYNRRLYLFWPKFTEKAKEVKNKDLKEGQQKLPEKYYEIQMSWSEYKNGKWAAKKISGDFIEGSSLKKKQYLFRAEITRENELRISIFLHDYFFSGRITGWDLTTAYVLYKEPPGFKLNGCNGELEKVKGSNIYIKPLKSTIGHFMKFKDETEMKEEIAKKAASDYEEAKKDKEEAQYAFDQAENNLKLLVQLNEIEENAGIAVNAITKEAINEAAQEYTKKHNKLQDAIGKLNRLETELENANKAAVKLATNPLILPGDNEQDEVVLELTPGIYSILYPHQYGNFQAETPFFYEDDKRTFFVTPEFIYGIESNTGGTGWEKDGIRIDNLTVVDDIYRDITVKKDYRNFTTNQASFVEKSERLYTDIYFRAGDQNRVVNRPRKTGYENTYQLQDLQYVLGEGRQFGLSPVKPPDKNKKYVFHSFYHPGACLFIKQLKRYGIEGLLDPDPKEGAGSFLLLRQWARNRYFYNTYKPQVNQLKLKLLTLKCINTEDLNKKDECFLNVYKDSGSTPKRLKKKGGIIADETWSLNETYTFKYGAIVTVEEKDKNSDDFLGAIFIDRTLKKKAIATFKKQGAYYRLCYSVIDESAEGTVTGKLPLEEIDFSYAGAYSSYNWELFFHAPLLVATRLSQNQKFEEAQKWFHYIFDPTDTSNWVLPPRRYWKIKPFFEYGETNTLQDLMKLMDEDDREMQNQVEQWEANPFQPHLLARLRIEAYIKTVVMKYIDNLIAWADQLFRRDSIESINEATQLYILAAQILGRRPEKIEAGDVKPLAFNDLQNQENESQTGMAVMSRKGSPVKTPNLLEQVETRIQTSLPRRYSLTTAISPAQNPRDENTFISNTVTTRLLPKKSKSVHLLDSLFDFQVSTENEDKSKWELYFCIPRNEKLLGYWDIVADRLFKIRHCMNIEGIVRQLPLFEPPIDPALLVKAAAAGIDIGSAISDLYAPLPHYRFNYMLQKAIELCGEVKSLGGAMLSALEKKDAEKLALLRAGHEIQMYKAMRHIKEQNIKETEESLASLQKTKEVTEIRYDYYSSRKYMNSNEKLHLDKLESSIIFQTIGQGLESLASGLALIPNVEAGGGGVCCSPYTVTDFGGKQLSTAVQIAGRAMSLFSSILSYQANKASIKGGYDRRADDWKLQEDMAVKELEQIDKQIAAAEIRKAIAEKDLQNHDLQIENAKEVEAFMKDKYTNKQLYDWMITQLSGIYFQSYQMAYDLAKQAEKAFQHELAKENTNFIQFGYWDNLKKGLLSGEKLHLDLKRMEIAYMEQNKREFEITKHISIAMLDPRALIELRETGTCTVDIPEILFDMDFPGQYMRRIKSISMTIPCVTGPYTNINCKLSLLQSRTRKSSNVGTDGYNYQGIDDTRFVHNIGGIQSIATSSGQNDSGLFELNFRDERYLPFEGAGAISKWSIELPGKLRQFDYDSISDVIIHMKYTARDDGQLKEKVEEEITVMINNMLKDAKGNGIGLMRLFSLKQEFPNQLHQFLSEPTGENPHSTTLTIAKKHFPYFLKNEIIEIQEVQLVLKLKDSDSIESLMINDNNVKLNKSEYGNLLVGTLIWSDTIESDTDRIDFTLSTPSISSETIEDMYLLVQYKLAN
jgi:hypothetical protein